MLKIKIVKGKKIVGFGNLRFAEFKGASGFGAYSRFGNRIPFKNLTVCSQALYICKPTEKMVLVWQENPALFVLNFIHEICHWLFDYTPWKWLHVKHDYFWGKFYKFLKLY